MFRQLTALSGPSSGAYASCLIQVLSSPDSEVARHVARYDYWYQVNQDKPAPGFGIPYVDTSEYILNQRSSDDRLESLSVSGTDRHMNSQGNLGIAEALVQELESTALLAE